MVVPAGSPTIVIDDRMSRSPAAATWSPSAQQGELGGLGIASVMVPAARMMVSAPAPAAQSGHTAASLLALMMASRMEQLPSVTRVSAVVVTTIVLPSAGTGTGTTTPATAAATTTRRRS